MRFGVITLSILGCVGGSVMAGLGWDSALHKGEWRRILLGPVRRGNIPDSEPGCFRRDRFLLIYRLCRHFSPWVRSFCAP
jgi:hypothetical protein